MSASLDRAGVCLIKVSFKVNIREINLGTSATVHLTGGVRFMQCLLNTGFTVF